MSTKRKTNDESNLDRGIAALRDTPIPPGPSRATQAATLAALSRGAAPRTVSRRFIGAPVLARAAVLACLAAGAAAAYFTLLRHDGHYVRTGPPALPITPVIATDVSMITGEIRFEGNTPPPRLIDVGPAGGCPGHRDRTVYDESLLLNLDDTLQNVVVSVVAGLPQGSSYPEPAAPVYLDQTGCVFEPHILAMQTGQPIVLRNSDPIPHNIHSLSVRNKSFNITQPGPDAGLRLPSPAVPEIFQVQCDIHPWMKAWFCAFNHPYFNVSSANGTFTLNGLPPGHYRLQAWQERLGILDREVIVKPGHDETVNFVYRLPSTAKSPQASLRTSDGLAACERTG